MMKDRLISILETFGYPVFQQGSLTEDTTYPDSFFTFWNNETSSDCYYDNEEHSYVWDFDINFYSIDPELVNTKLIEVKALLKIHGFAAYGKGHDVMSDEITHTGRGINVLVKEEK